MKCDSKAGSLEYDTDQDAWYFGVWVHLGDRMVVSYAEGDCTVEVYDTEEEFRVQLAAMSRFYGAPPPGCVCVGPEGVTRVYDDDASRALDRPTQVRP